MESETRSGLSPGSIVVAVLAFFVVVALAVVIALGNVAMPVAALLGILEVQA